MSRLRNRLLKLVVRATTLSANELCLSAVCLAPGRQAHLWVSNSIALGINEAGCRSFASCDVDLRNASWAGCPQPLQLPCAKEYNGFTWRDEYSWMDPTPSAGCPVDKARPGNSSVSIVTTPTPTPTDPSRRAALLRRHLQREEDHTRRVLAAAGVESLKWQLLAELRERFLSEPQDPPPERLGPYDYSVVSGPDGGLLAYTRTPALEPIAAATAAAATVTVRHSQASRPVPEMLLSRDIVARDARVATQMTGLRLGDAVGALKLCPRHRLLAYSLPVADRPDLFCVLVRDTAAGRLVLPGGVVGGIAGPAGMELAADGRSLLLLRPDSAGRPAQVVLHDLRYGTPPRLLLTESDPRFFLGLGRSKDWALLLLNSNSKTCSEVHILDAARPGSAPPRLVQPRTPGLEYFVEHHKPRKPQDHTQSQAHQFSKAQKVEDREADGRLIILTNADPRALRGGGGGGDGSDGSALGGEGRNGGVGPGGRGRNFGRVGCGGGPGPGSGGGGRELTVVCAPLSQPGLPHWRPLLPRERPGVVVTDMDVFADCIVLYERRQGLPAVSVLPLPGTRDPRGDSAAVVGTSTVGHEDDNADIERPQPEQVPLPPWALHVAPGGANADPLSPVLRLSASSPLHPPALLELHLASRRLRPLAREQPPASARDLLARCSLARVQVESPSSSAEEAGSDGGGDGPCTAVRVPVTLVLPPGVSLATAVNGGGDCDSGGGGKIGSCRSGNDSDSDVSLGDDGGDGEPKATVVAAAPRLSWRSISGPGQFGTTDDVAELGAGGGGDFGGSSRIAVSGHPGAQIPAPGPEGSGSGRAGPRPLLLSVYGAYGMSLELQYDPTLLCLLARGWAVAKVHVRGGGELGRSWQAAGSRRLKRVAVEDCLAATAALMTARIQAPHTAKTMTAVGRVAAAAAAPGAAGTHAALTAPGLVAGHAISAGGIVLGAALNAAPGVFGAAVLRCAFLELLGSCSDPGQPLTAHEWDEWGDPTDPRDWAALRDLCPYNNLHQTVDGGGWRTAVLASCAEGDPRVHPSIPAKWVARLRDQLCRTHDIESYGSEGHAGGKDGAAGNVGGGRAAGSWRRLLDCWFWSRSRDRTLADTATASAPAPAGPGGDDGGSTDGSRAGTGRSDGRVAGRPGVCAPLLRVHFDGAGHMREGLSAQAEEVAEEVAFLLVALGEGGRGSGELEGGCDAKRQNRRQLERAQ